MSNYWYYGPGADGNTPTLLLTGAEAPDAATYVGTVSQSGEWSNSGYTSINRWPWHGIRSEIKSVLTLESNPIYMADLSRMNSMFSTCSSLASVDVSGFDTSKVTNMSDMFYDCSTLISLDLSRFDTSKVTNMSSMFKSCSSLVSLDVSGFDTSLVTNMNSMFCDCLSLTSIDVSGFNTSKVTGMNSMFRICSHLTSIDVSEFDTSLVTDMSYMFCSCSSLASIDVSGFDTSKVTSMSNMFTGCKSLRIIDISPNMSNVLSQLPASTYYDAATRQSYAKADIPGGGTYVRDLADLDPVSTMIQNRQAVRSLRHMVNKLSKRIVALETSVSSLMQ